MPPVLRPGFVTPRAAQALQGAAHQAEAARRELERLTRQVAGSFPVKLTAWGFDSVSGLGAASWTRQIYDTNMLRIDDPNTLTGGPGWMPAFAVGDGPMPPADGFPVEVMLNYRCVRAHGDPVFEFDWACGCAATSGSGSGSGGGIATDCCAESIPSTLHATITGTGGTACPSFDGAVITINHVNGLQIWSGSASLGGYTMRVSLQCTGGSFVITFAGLEGTCSWSQSGSASSVCSPFSVSQSFTRDTSPTTCCSSDTTIMITIVP